jgi:hypothetical protein
MGVLQAQFQRQKCKDVALHACGSESTKRNQSDFSSFSANWSSAAGAIDYLLDVATDSSFINYVPGYQNLSVGNVTSFPVTGLSPQYHLLLPSASPIMGCNTSANSSAKNARTVALHACGSERTKRNQCDCQQL